MTTYLKNLRIHHGTVNWLLNAVLGAVLFIIVPYAGTELFKTVANWSLVHSFKPGSPFSPTAHYYHPGDKMDVSATRYADFDATVESSRLLRKINVGTIVEEVMDRQTLPLTSIEHGPHSIIFHPVLPEHLPPGHYHYVFPGRYTLYDRTNNFVWTTKEFEIVSPDTPITEDMQRGD